MGKLYIRNILVGMIFMGISVAIATAVIALLSLASASLSVIFCYILSGIIGLACGIFLEKFFISKYNYFNHKEVDDTSTQKSIWIQRIKEKNYVKRWGAYLTYLPIFIVSVVIIVFAILIYPTLSNSIVNNKWYSVICAVIGASAISILVYGILGITSFKVCKKCGTVNAFIYDETIDYEAMADMETKTEAPSGNWRAFVKQSTRSYGSKNNGNAKRSMADILDGKTHSERKVERFTDKIARHCDCCGEKSVIVEEAVINGKWNKS